MNSYFGFILFKFIIGSLKSKLEIKTVGTYMELLLEQPKHSREHAIRKNIQQTLKKIRPTRVVLKARLKHRKPAWATGHPVALQLDTQTRCTLKCVYCNPQSCFIKTQHKTEMDLSVINRVTNTLKSNKVLLSYVFAYMNGDPLLENRLPIITEKIKKTVNCPITLFTNGAEAQNKYLLIDKYLDEVKFTISASNRELYKKIHGRDKFLDVIKTFQYFIKNKYPNQSVGLNFVLFDKNIHDLQNWKKMFSEYPQDIRYLHTSESQDTSNKLSANNPIIEQMKKDFFKRLIKRERPCTCFGSMQISVDGKLMQCCDLPYEYNYGHVEEIDLLEQWNKRLDQGLDAPGCKECTQRNPHWRELFEKYVW